MSEFIPDLFDGLPEVPEGDPDTTMLSGLSRGDPETKSGTGLCARVCWGNDEHRGNRAENDRNQSDHL